MTVHSAIERPIKLVSTFAGLKNPAGVRKGFCSSCSGQRLHVFAGVQTQQRKQQKRFFISW
jgi:hypothetical protein